MRFYIRFQYKKLLKTMKLQILNENFGVLWVTHSIPLTHTAPPVEEGFDTDCPMQKKLAKHIECEEDGSFSPVQCMGPMCFCVDTTTGERLNGVTFEKKDRHDVNCSEGV